MMKYGQLIIESREMATLTRIISSIPSRLDESYKASIRKFSEELKSAKRLAENEMPGDVVRFNSLVTFTDSASVKRTYQIVAPKFSDISKKRISVLAPMGLALFGYSVNDQVEWQFPSGTQLLKIIKIEQCQTSVSQKQNA